MAAAEKLASLRHLLERFSAPPRAAGGVLPTGLAALDRPLGGLPLAGVTELVCAAPSSGGGLLLEALLAAARLACRRAAVIDAADAFDPQSHPADLLAHVLWVRCRRSADALPVADLLTHDANLGLVVLDLRRGAGPLLRQTPGTVWYRLQRAVEAADLALVVLTPHAAVASAQLRFVLDQPLPFEALEDDRPRLLAALAPVLDRQRLQAVSS
jgi:hypothetical protein